MARRKIELPTEREYTVNYPSGLNVRAEPSTNAAILRVLKRGVTVASDAEDAPEGWVALRDGGYCMKRYLD